MSLEFEIGDVYAEESEGLARYVNIIDKVKKLATKSYKTNLRTFYYPDKVDEFLKNDLHKRVNDCPEYSESIILRQFFSKGGGIDWLSAEITADKNLSKEIICKVNFAVYKGLKEEVSNDVIGIIKTGLEKEITVEDKHLDYKDTLIETKRDKFLWANN